MSLDSSQNRFTEKGVVEIQVGSKTLVGGGQFSGWSVWGTYGKDAGSFTMVHGIFSTGPIHFAWVVR